jgi:GNAT superfamily N-acetyltransferase
VEAFRARGLRARLALDDAGQVGAMIQYLPIEQSWVQGEGLYFIPCIWVHGHKEGRGDFRGHGMGTALLEAAEADARALGARGMAAWGIWLPFWMRSAWFRKHGYRKADRQGMAVLMWKPFSDDAQPPRWRPRGTRLPEPVPGKVNVTVFTHGWCMAMNLVAERAKRAAAEFGDQVAVQVVETSEPAQSAAWGQCDALYIDGKPVGFGPPLTLEKIRGLIARRVKRLPS